ncbi:FG-GAP repeat domain-containing protein [Streptacidiphilus sp. N1-3]|uniref:FG-GAP repeat domain-containing protein n=1 Tax=Streptacidiphilus alkalitolerans TaxID=3342712 RepID=A0ABV6XD85_9ACTN
MKPRPPAVRRYRNRRAAALITTTALGVAGLAVPAHAAPAHAAPAHAATAGGGSAHSAAALPADRSPAATAARQAKASGKPVVINSLTTATQQIAVNPGGSFTATISATPTRVFRAGRWIAINTALHRNADGTLSPGAVAGDLVLSGGGTAPLATLTASGQRLSLAWPTALPVPTVSADTATYHNVLPGTDLAVTATAQGGVSDVLIVKTAQAAANPALRRLNLATTGPGLTISADADGNLTATDTHHRAAFYAPAPTMWDSTPATSATPPTPATAPSPSTVAASVAQAPETPAAGSGASTFRSPGAAAHRTRVPAEVVGGHTVALVPDPAALTATSNRYPLFIDPAWSRWTGQNPGYAEVKQGCPNSANSGNSTAYEPQGQGEGVGYNGSPSCIGSEETYYQFTLPSAVYGTTINTADTVLKTTELYSASASLSATVSAHLATSPISPSTDWKNRPGFGPALSSKTVGPASSTNKPSTGFAVASAVAAAKEGAVLTFALTGDEKSADKAHFKRFSTTPTLVVEYNSKPTVTSAYTAPDTTCTAAGPPFSKVGNTAITLKAQLNDIEPGSTMTAHFTYSTYNGAEIASTTTGSVLSDGVAQWNIGALPSGDYTWTVSANDGTDDSATTTCHFTVSADAPGPPGISSSVFPTTDQYPSPNPDRNAGGTNDFTFTPAAGSSDTVAYAYAWGAPPPTVNPPQTVSTTAGTGPTSITLTPPGQGANKLYVYAIDSAGNISTTAEQNFFTQYGTGPTVALATDFNDDNIPDVIGVGTTANPGLWLYEGNADHTLAPPIQLGAQGTANGTGTAADWNGATVSSGFLDDDSEGQMSGAAVHNPDLLVRTPDGGLNIYRGTGNTGDGTTFIPNGNNVFPVSFIDAQGNELPGTNLGRQVIPAGALTSDGYSGAWIYPNISAGESADLWAIQGDQLGYYAATTGTAMYSPFAVVSGSGWADKTIVNAGQIGGLPALWARDNTTGELDLYTSSDPNIAAGSADSTKTVVATSGYATADYTMLTSAGTTGPDGCPQLQGIDATTGTFTFIPCTSMTTLGTPVTTSTSADTLSTIDGSALDTP